MRIRFPLAFRMAGTLSFAVAASIALAQEPTPAKSVIEGGASAEATVEDTATPALIDSLPDGVVPADGPVLGEGIVFDGVDGGGASELFYNYYVPPVNGGVGAGMYPAPLPVPPHVGHVYYTYQPFYPHEHLYAHSRTYYRYHPGFEGYWYNGVYGRWPNYAGYGGHGYAGVDGFTPYTKTTVHWTSSRAANAANRIFGKVRNFNSFDPSP